MQAVINNPDRMTTDMLDIENIIKINKKELKMDMVKEYFALFGMEDELDKIMEKI